MPLDDKDEFEPKLTQQEYDRMVEELLRKWREEEVWRTFMLDDKDEFPAHHLAIVRAWIRDILRFKNDPLRILSREFHNKDVQRNLDAWLRQVMEGEDA
jgi:hypothetical protein